MEEQRLLATTQVLGITTSLLSAGMYFITSNLVILPLLPLPINESTRIFADLYHNGKGVQVPLTVGSSVAFAIASYLSPRKRLEYGAAGVAAISTMVVTVLFMFGGIERLLAITKMDGSQIQRVSKAEVQQLLQAWRGQNYVRALLSFISGLVGLYATIY